MTRLAAARLPGRQRGACKIMTTAVAATPAIHAEFSGLVSYGDLAASAVLYQ
jgi:hypothetical protein